MRGGSEISVSRGPSITPFCPMRFEWGIRQAVRLLHNLMAPAKGMRSSMVQWIVLRRTRQKAASPCFVQQPTVYQDLSKDDKAKVFGGNMARLLEL